MAHLQSSADVLMQVVSDNSRSERRISPAWTVDTLKTRLEPITGIPVAAQRLSLRGGTNQSVDIDADGSIQLHNFNVASFSELRVSTSNSLCTGIFLPAISTQHHLVVMTNIMSEKLVDHVIRSMTQDLLVLEKTTPMSQR